MLEGTFLEVMRLELHQALGIYWQMSHFRTYSQRGLADVAGIHRNSANQYCLFVREALAVRNRFTLIQPGGPGKKVFVDECWIGTRWKYHRGNRSRGLHEREVGARSANGRKVMLLVLSEHGSNRTVIFHIRKRDVNKLERDTETNRETYRQTDMFIVKDTKKISSIKDVYCFYKSGSQLSLFFAGSSCPAQRSSRTELRCMSPLTSGVTSSRVGQSTTRLGSLFAATPTITSSLPTTSRESLFSSSDISGNIAVLFMIESDSR